ncbi:MAG: hypothetical protein ABIS03_03450 [Gemmatimonadaceae bacterium]
MRQFVVIGVLACVAACSGGSTAPGSSINIRLLDDSGQPAGRNQVLVVPSTGAKFTAHTGHDGMTNVPITAGGTYKITVIPRDGFVGGNDPLTKSVMADIASNSAVQFILYRTSLPPDKPEPYNPNYPGFYPYR